ncbi:MAG: hypothetical protein MJE68_29295 [Proteobacteria bacterium]|nr:hypothetical protein [Pseudomonadota bacterium]
MPTFDCDEAEGPEPQHGNDPGTSYSGYSRYRPEMPTFDCDEVEGPEPQCGNDKDSESDSESSPQDWAPDRRRSHTNSQDDDSD